MRCSFVLFEILHRSKVNVRALDITTSILMML